MSGLVLDVDDAQSISNLKIEWVSQFKVKIFLPFFKKSSQPRKTVRHRYTYTPPLKPHFLCHRNAFVGKGRFRFSIRSFRKSVHCRPVRVREKGGGVQIETLPLKDHHPKIK